jgi:hypothetical protein
VIKGLNYQTTTHPSGVTDEAGAFKCQPGEVAPSVATRSTNLSACIADINAALACFDASTAVVLEDNSASLFITLVALATTVFAVSKAESVPSGVTDEAGAFKCQPGEVVAFSIENLSLTQVDCQAILQTRSLLSQHVFLNLV